LSTSDDLMTSYASESFDFIYDLQNIFIPLFVKTNCLSILYLFYGEKGQHTVYLMTHVSVDINHFLSAFHHVHASLLI
jgi:hypothetical protein